MIQGISYYFSVAVFDADGNGLIDAHELSEAMCRLHENISESEAREMIRDADTDGDGKINLEGTPALLCMSVYSIIPTTALYFYFLQSSRS